MESTGRNRIRNTARTLLAVGAALIGVVLAVPALLVSLPFGAVAVLTRWLAGRMQPDSVPWENLIEFDASIGWKPRRSMEAVALDLNGDPFRVTTDEEGWRGAGSVDEAGIVVFGDSFAFGSGIDDAGFFAELEGEPRIKSIGAPGYNLVQSLLWMERLSDRLRGKVVVWLAYAANDLDDNLMPHMDGYRMPFLRQDEGGWEVVREHLGPEPWPFVAPRQNNKRFIDICLAAEDNDRVYDAMGELLDRAQALCEKAGAALVVATVPDLSAINRRARLRILEERGNPRGFDENAADRRIEELCRERGIDCLPLRDHVGLEDYLRYDVHWTPAGHRQVARAIRAAAAEAVAKSPSSDLSGLEAPASAERVG